MRIRSIGLLASVMAPDKCQYNNWFSQTPTSHGRILSCTQQCLYSSMCLLNLKSSNKGRWMIGWGVQTSASSASSKSRRVSGGNAWLNCRCWISSKRSWERFLRLASDNQYSVWGGTRVDETPLYFAQPQYNNYILVVTMGLSHDVR